jgi:hypothetical protein
MTPGAAAFIFPAAHAMAVAALALSLLLWLGRKRRAAGCLFPAALVCLGVNLALIVGTGSRLPLYGMFESATTILWVAGCGLLLARGRAGSTEFGVGCGVLAFLGAAAGFFPLGMNHDFFMYASAWVQGFFFFRLVSAGILLLAGIGFLAILADARKPGAGPCPQKRQARLLLAAAVFFLLSELSGSIWCLKGWGDTWLWSGNFFQSAAVFFLIMINLHIPPGMLRSVAGKSALGTLSSFAAIFLFLW